MILRFIAIAFAACFTLSTHAQYLMEAHFSPAGMSRTLTAPSLRMDVTVNGNWLLFSVSDQTRPETWTFWFQTPGSGPVSVGRYPTTGGVGTAQAAQAGMSLGPPGRWCDGPGTFIVYELLSDVEGKITRTAVDFEQNCGGAKMYGALRYNSPIPYSVPAPVTSAAGLVLGPYMPIGRQYGAATLAIASPSGSCSIANSDFNNPPDRPAPLYPPWSLEAPDVYVSLRLVGCARGESVTYTVEMPEVVANGTQWWVLGRTADNASDHWYPIRSTVDGKRITFAITDGGPGDSDGIADGKIALFGMPAVIGGKMQDLWWGGPAENGWGMSLIQHRDVLFGNLFVYDAKGNPTWYVMPSVKWSNTNVAYVGDLYLPAGSPFYAYDPSKFAIGRSVGWAEIKLHPALVNQASLSLTIDGYNWGGRPITRVAFGPFETPLEKPVGDLWWGGAAQNGWGIVIVQQYKTLFALWYTYDAKGDPTWFVMPGGSWAAKDDYRGSVYTAVGPPWSSFSYDVSRHHVTEAGTFALRFSGEAATFDYSVSGKSGSIPLTRIPF